MNSVLLYLKENPGADLKDSTAHVMEILDKKWAEMLQHVLMDGFGELPKPCKLLHLSCLKVFQMFFHSSNRFDSNTEMLQDIQNAIYVPINVGLNSKAPLINLMPREQGLFQAINSHSDSGRPSKHETSQIELASS